MESHSQENHVGDVKSNTLNKLQITKKHKIQISYTMMTDISHQTETIQKGKNHFKADNNKIEKFKNLEGKF